MEPGDLVGGRFRLQGAVGAGGMGVVFRALDERSGDTVALKLIDVRDAVELARARREAHALAQLAHPAIVRYIDDGEDGKLYLAMQWIDGVTARERLASTGLSLREAVAVTRRIAEALSAAHDAGILHRDVKPTNVILAGGDPARAVLIDFGIARTAGERALTRTGTTLGTPGYMAPEQARGERLLTPAVDVFGLGCLFYECATGRPAFSGTLHAALLTKILFGAPEPLTALCPEAPRALEDALARMLDKDPRVRIGSGAEVVRALDAAGEIPDGPRRGTGALELPTARAPVATGDVHCLVLASRGHPDETLDQPELGELEQLRAELAPWHAEPVALRTGAVVVHLAGGRDEMPRRAGFCALATKRVFPDWTVVITSIEPELASAADTGTQLLSTAGLAMIFRKLPGDGVVLDRVLVPLLAGDFELALEDPPRLLAPRAP